MTHLTFAILISTFISTSAYACKRSALSSDLSRVRALTEKSIEGLSFSKQQQLNLKGIYIKNNLYVVEIADNSGSCNATTYEVTTRPNCDQKIKIVSDKQACILN